MPEPIEYRAILNLQAALQAFARISAALICGALALASWRFVASEMEASHELAYGLPIWWVQAAMPMGFALLAAKLGSACFASTWLKALGGMLLPAAGFALAGKFDGAALLLWPHCNADLNCTRLRQAIRH